MNICQDNNSILLLNCKQDIAYVMQYLCQDLYKVKFIKNKNEVCIRGKGNTFLFNKPFAGAKIWFFLTQERREREYLINHITNTMERITPLFLYYKILSYEK